MRPCSLFLGDEIPKEQISSNARTSNRDAVAKVKLHVDKMPPREMNYGSVPTDEPLEFEGGENGDGYSFRESELGKVRKTFPGQSSGLWNRVGKCAALVLLLIGAILAVFYLSSHFSGDDDSSFGSASTIPAVDLTLSTASPEHPTFGFPGVDRVDGADPSSVWGDVPGPYPTNSWYLNLVSHKAATKPDDMTRVYTVPYIVDTAPPEDMAGIRVHWPVVKTSATNIQMVDDFKNGVSLGSTDVDSAYKVDADEELSHLGVSLQWGDKSADKAMTTHIVRGMPYATMRYYGTMPMLHSYNAPASDLLVDGETKVDCAEESEFTIEKEVQLHFRNSDFTWALFVSKPVKVSCEIIGDDINVAQFSLSVLSYAGDEEDEEPLTVRLALIDQCTTGKSDVHQHCEEKDQWKDQEGYIKLLKERAHLFPTSPTITFDYPKEGSDDEKVDMTIDWEAKSSAVTVDGDADDKDDLIMFALPHHYQTDLADAATTYCIPAFHGKTCLVEGATWSLSEDVSTPVSFTAGRPPEASAIPMLAEALNEDIHYRLSDNMLRGAADTYFSGKILARLGRVIAIASELRTLADGSIDTVKPLYNDDVEEDVISASIQIASETTLPSAKDIEKAVNMLRRGVEIWLTNKAEAIYVFDRSWGGFVNCGCHYTGKGEHGYCNNTFPDCPALEDVNEDFGNGFYNDHHFHYGYHVYAAAVVAKHDPEWGAEYFDQVLFYIRDIANPSEDDEYFVQYRQKDWFLGSSWAAGIVSAENSPHGRNQESSSEAIAAYEGVALYGSAMIDAFSQSGDGGGLKLAKQVFDAGALLMSTEIRATNRYWHVWSSDDHVNTYPPGYERLVVGMMYETMASFQTWFGPDAILSYGIQLIPLTPVGEYRDDPVWATKLYPVYEESCETSKDLCVDNGWSIMQAGLLATTGKREEALEQAMEVPTKVFAGDGGIGNSLTNTLWYIATRPAPTKSS